MGEGLKGVVLGREGGGLGGGGWALKRDDRRGEMQIFPLCLFLSILWIYVAFPVMK